MRRDASRGGHQIQSCVYQLSLFRLHCTLHTIHCLDVLTIQCDPCVMSFTVLHVIFNGWILWYKISLYVLRTCGLRVGGWGALSSELHPPSRHLQFNFADEHLTDFTMDVTLLHGVT